MSESQPERVLRLIRERYGSNLKLQAYAVRLGLYKDAIRNLAKPERTGVTYKVAEPVAHDLKMTVRHLLHGDDPDGFVEPQPNFDILKDSITKVFEEVPKDAPRPVPAAIAHRVIAYYIEHTAARSPPKDKKGGSPFPKKHAGGHHSG